MLNKPAPSDNLMTRAMREDVEREKREPLHQSDIPPGTIKRRHLFDKVMVFGLDADLPTDSSSGVFCYFATDTNTLYCYNGSSWVGTTLS